MSDEERSQNVPPVKIARIGEEPREITIPKEMTVARLLRLAEIRLAEGEVVVREGETLRRNTLVRPGDVIFLEENDDNG